MKLTHINENNQPRMVAIGDKSVTSRSATAQAILALPPEVLPSLKAAGSDRMAAKGPVFQTAILAGIQAAKRTSELIPLCHLIPLETCHMDIIATTRNTIEITCTAKATHKTGVEMEALTGATVAALTVYDMCKALSHHIVIKEVRLLSKTGGKSDFTADPEHASSHEE